MKQCPQCGARYPDEHQFCPQDGADLVPFAAPVAASVAAAVVEPPKLEKPVFASPEAERADSRSTASPLAYAGDQSSGFDSQIGVANAAAKVSAGRALLAFALAVGMLVGIWRASDYFVGSRPDPRFVAAQERLESGQDDAPETDENLATEANNEGDADTEGDADGGTEGDAEGFLPDSVGESEQEAERFGDCSASASSYLKSAQGNQYEPSVVLDAMSSTAWNAENKRHGVGEWVQLSWPAEREVSRIGVIVGYDKQSDKPQYRDDPWMWNRNNRVREATLLFSSGDKVKLSFDDITTMQYRDFAPVRASWVRLMVDDVYLDKYGGTDPKWDDIAIAEMQVWGQP